MNYIISSDNHKGIITRHTHVAFLLASGIDLYVISKRLGHSDLSTTSKIYAYLIDEFKARSDQKIEKELNKLTVKKASDKASKIS
ncbi:hypothetical protein EFN35_08930 [Pediococcus parvulus]|nr:hypothetical protein [Pediococcus parvulus]GHC14657.1 hypothetical protein GCM10008912_17820 [Pediococcus parvulus]